MGKILQSYRDARTVSAQRTTMPFADGLSPLTNKSRYAYPMGGRSKGNDFFSDFAGGDNRITDIKSRGNWSDGGHEEKSYREEGDEFMRQDRILEKLRGILQRQKKGEQWVLQTIDGQTYQFNSQPAAHKAIRDKNLKVRQLSKVAQESSDPVIQKGLDSTCTVYSQAAGENSMEVGAAFCVGRGYFMTCAHVLQKYSKHTLPTEINPSLQISLNYKGQSVSADVVNMNFAQDIAIVRSDLALPPLEFDTNPLKVADDIFVIGSPKGWENTVSEGIISGTNRKVYHHKGSTEHIFTDAKILPGNSGGPMFLSSTGKVVGMMEIIVSPDGPVGLNAAIPSVYLYQFLKDQGL